MLINPVQPEHFYNIVGPVTDCNDLSPTAKTWGFVILPLSLNAMVFVSLSSLSVFQTRLPDDLNNPTRQFHC